MAGLALLAGCSTAPQRVAVAPPPPPKVARPELPYRWTQGNAPKAWEEAVAVFGPLRLRPGQYRWAATIPETGDTHVVIDTLTQLLYVYRDDKLIGVATISSGKKGRETPLGFWSVMNKQVKGYSRKYDNAPMPFMQMYDSKGIAFHAGPNPGYPASHGCVRLPLKFAEKLYTLTKVGSKVVIEG
ncbi:L,D-transpeptidase family protein [Sphingomonas sp. URHD0057]|uniref:L,D-transpeptidase family protein n=1 Tax=Sphingomonas sp. URHD0057 TaxID=1380389 RepID=UPI001E610FAB|nr:L,D-transpeptidase family protein [Sphingomonas sp. URHD0057]